MTRWHLVAAALLLAGCQRKAPGPHECRRFAVQALGIPMDARQVSPEAYVALEELTRRCITTPFDRALIRCVDGGRPARYCLTEFQRRTASPHPQQEP